MVGLSSMKATTEAPIAYGSLTDSLKFSQPSTEAGHWSENTFGKSNIPILLNETDSADVATLLPFNRRIWPCTKSMCNDVRDKDATG